MAQTFADSAQSIKILRCSVSFLFFSFSAFLMKACSITVVRTKFSITRVCTAVDAARLVSKA